VRASYPRSIVVDMTPFDPYADPERESLDEAVLDGVYDDTIDGIDEGETYPVNDTDGPVLPNIEPTPDEAGIVALMERGSRA